MKSHAKTLAKMVAVLAIIALGFWLLGLALGWWFYATIAIWMDYGSSTALYWLIGDTLFIILVMVILW